MTRSPIVAALLSLSLAFQLMLVGGGASCVDGDHASMHSSATDVAAMSGMDMPMPEGDGHEPCDQSATPGACKVTAACSGGFIAVAAADLDRPVPAGTRAVGLIPTAPPSRTVPPELPPPRV